MHLFPQLRKLEEKYPDHLLVIGVHSPKFPAERDLQVVREAVMRYEIAHPVVSDPDHAVWRSLGIRAWPSLLFIDPEGRAVGRHEGELPFEAADRLVGAMLAEYRAAGLLDPSPPKLDLPERPPASPLSYPGKLIPGPGGSSLFVSDTNHNRIVEIDPHGTVLRVFGSGEQGFEDGEGRTASFDHPQGLALHEGSVFVADTQNHAVRAVDLATGMVSTIAGTGARGHRGIGGPAARTSLASPWDLVWFDGRLVIAMAGMHQLWAYRPEVGEVGVYAGAGDEGLRDGPRQEAALAQTNGLAVLGDRLFFADSETSSIRSVEPDNRVVTHVGTGLFDFGDRDGHGLAALLQHPQGICAAGEALYFTDTYNNKIKRLDPATGDCRTFAGSGEAGYADGPAEEARFNEPGGICVLGDRLYVADTNNHAIRVVELETGEVTTLAVGG
jgi:sugar lactone lactonase YvrE